ncbi:MAG TPA: hypothetical protein VGC41_01680 [Kofleriaceae bacterium]
MRTLLLLAIAVAGCGHKPSPDEANALVDPTKSPKLHFEVKEAILSPHSKHEHRLGIVIPVGWSPDDHVRFNSDARDSTASHGAFTSSCAVDPCSVGDFQADIDADLRERDKVVGAKVLRDTKTPTSRFTVTRDVGNRVVIERHWWRGDSPDEIFSCSFVIMDDLLASQAAFEKACDLAVVEN